MRFPTAPRTIKRLAPQIGAKAYLEPEYQFAGYIEFKNGKRSFFNNATFNINTLGSSMIAKDKGYTSHFLNKFGYNVPQGITFFNDERNANIKTKRGIFDALRFCKKIGFPVIVKPNDKSLGEKVCKANNKGEFLQFAKKILRDEPVALVERFYAGNDYRVVVLDGKVISCYQRIPLSITGDGVHSVLWLLQSKQKKAQKEEMDVRIDPHDFRILANLKRQKLTLKSILPNGKKLFLLDNANLTTGGDAIDHTSTIHMDYAALCVSIAKDLSLRHCGIDIVTSDIRKSLDPSHVVLEVNSAPGLDNYASKGLKQKKIVDALYLEILKALEQDA
jgi:D-alanine-D-alanine ligase-like ATP-grasp enzyme